MTHCCFHGLGRRNLLHCARPPFSARALETLGAKTSTAQALVKYDEDGDGGGDGDGEADGDLFGNGDGEGGGGRDPLDPMLVHLRRSIRKHVRDVCCYVVVEVRGCVGLQRAGGVPCMFSCSCRRLVLAHVHSRAIVVVVSTAVVPAKQLSRFA